MAEPKKSNTGLIIAVIAIVVVVLLLLILCACVLIGMGGFCIAGPSISGTFSGINSAIQATPIRR